MRVVKFLKCAAVIWCARIRSALFRETLPVVYRDNQQTHELSFVEPNLYILEIQFEQLCDSRKENQQIYEEENHDFYTNRLSSLENS